MWDNPTRGVNKLQYRKAGADEGSERPADYFSFDLGGNLLGGRTDGHLFAAEVKRHTDTNDHGVEYRRFLAKCYRVDVVASQMYDHYLWVSWAPFLLRHWRALLTEEFVVRAVEFDEENKRIALGPDRLDTTLAKKVAEKLIIVILSDRQQDLLSLHGKDLLWARKALVARHVR